MREIWKPISGYEGMYEVSSTGLVRSYVKSTKRKGLHILKPTANERGYLAVTLYQRHGSRKKFLVHRLVAEAFLKNPNGYPCINHKDEDVTNNNVENLEWCTYAYNNSYGTAKIRAIGTKSKRVKQYTIDGIWIATYLSVGIASKLTGVPRSVIKECCKKQVFSYGYMWAYSNDD